MSNQLLKLLAALGSDDPLPQFAAIGELSSAALRLEVAGFGPLPNPLTIELASELARAGAPAAFGHREKTLVDPDVRNSQEISSEKLTLSWAPGVQAELLQTITQSFGLAGLEARAHGLSIYGPGGFFKVQANYLMRIGGDSWGGRRVTYRTRLTDVSWLMKSLSEAIARRANIEDKVTGKFWEGRFKSQLLLSEKSILAAMTYVDLNPVRADIAKGVSTSSYTSVKMRHERIRKDATHASRQLMPLAGIKSANIPTMTEAEYIALVDFTGREWRPGKRGVIKVDEPPALRKLGLDKDHWTMKVKGVGSSYWRVVGTLEELIEKAKELKQRTLFGIGFARFLKNI